MATAQDRPTAVHPGERHGLRVVSERSGSAVLVRAGGTVDASNVEVWRRLVSESARITAAGGSLIVDTSELEFMAVCAFAVLVDESARCRGRGIRLCLVSSQRVVERVVRSAGLDTVLSFSSNLEDVLCDTRREGPGSAARNQRLRAPLNVSVPGCRR